MIEARLTKRFLPGDESAAFALDVSFTAEGGITVLFGASGAGKSLTLDSIAGFTKPDAGRVLLNDRILFDADAHVDLPPRLRRCGYVLQQQALFPHMTLRENLVFAAQPLARLERHRGVSDMLDKFGLMTLAGRYPHELSGGQKQRGSIARALIAAPEVLLLDEPARGLDAQLRDDLQAALATLRADLAIPVLLVTHDLQEAFALGDSLLIYDVGHIVQRGKPQDLLEHPVSREAAALLGLTNIIEAEVRALDPGRNTSKLRALGTDLNGRYYPGHFIGDRVNVCISPASISLQSLPGDNRVAAELQRTSRLAGFVRVEFSNGMIAQIRAQDYVPAKDNEKCYLELPAGELKLIG